MSCRKNDLRQEIQLLRDMLSVLIFILITKKQTKKSSTISSYDCLGVRLFDSQTIFVRAAHPGIKGTEWGLTRVSLMFKTLKLGTFKISMPVKAFKMCKVLFSCQQHHNYKASIDSKPFSVTRVLERLSFLRYLESFKVFWAMKLSVMLK